MDGRDRSVRPVSNPLTMAADKRWRLVCYDVRDDKRYRRVFKIVKGAGESVQYSIFRCRLDDAETERLRWRLAKVMAEEDALLIVDLCPSCAGRVIARNFVAGWAEVPPAFRIIDGDLSVHGPVDDGGTESERARKPTDAKWKARK